MDPIPSKFYAVVYGNGWEDIEYFSSYNKACIKLIIQTLDMTTFHPLLVEYINSDHGVMERTKNMMAITDLSCFQNLVKTEVKNNPYIAFHLVKHIF